MSIEWSASLSSGLEWQDRQHKELFRRLDKLFDAMDLGLGKDELGRLLSFLDDYVVVHFEAEEQAMHRFAYPGMLAHLADHTRFIDRIAELKSEFNQGPTTAIVIKTKSELVDWFLNHIATEDIELGRYLLNGK